MQDSNLNQKLQSVRQQSVIQNSVSNPYGNVSNVTQSFVSDLQFHVGINIRIVEGRENRNV